MSVVFYDASSVASVVSSVLVSVMSTYVFGSCQWCQQCLMMSVVSNDVSGVLCVTGAVHI